MIKSNLSELIDGFFEEWTQTIVAVKEAVDRKDFKSVGHNIVTLHGMKTGNYVSRRGYRLLSQAANELLVQERLDVRVTEKSARQTLIDAFAAHLPKALKTGTLSDRAVIDRARAKLRAIKFDDGIYVFPARLAPLSKSTDFAFGPIRVLSKARFYRKYAATLRRESVQGKQWHVDLLKGWVTYAKGFDHFICVQMSGFEREMAWRMGRECAEFCLNIVRMFFGFGHTDDVRLGGELHGGMSTSHLLIEAEGHAWLSWASGGMSSVLEPGWDEYLAAGLQPLFEMLSSYAAWLANSGDARSPVTERLRYAHTLIAEAYTEQSDHLRLVRLISALEAVSLIDGSDKAHQLASRCASAGGWGATGEAIEIYDSMRAAYHWRNAVVHGDAPLASDVRRAFIEAERHLFRIMVGFMSLFAAIATDVQPRSVRQLRRELKRRIDLFFWAPDLAAGL